MKSLLPSLFLALAAAVFSGCVAHVETERKVFHLLSDKPASGSFAVLPGDGAKGSSLEFTHHAARTSIYLKHLGYRMINPGEQPDFVLRLDYGMTPVTSRRIRRYLTINMMDTRLSAQNKPALVYQGEVFSDGTSLNSAKIVPIMIDTLMRDFPGRIGNDESFSYPTNFDELVYQRNGPENAR